MESTVRKRIAYGVLMTVVMVVLLSLDGWLSCPAVAARVGALSLLGHGGLTTVIVAVIVGLGAYEMCRLAQRGGHRPTTVWCVLMVVLFVASPWWVHALKWPPLSDYPSQLAPITFAVEHVLHWLAIVGVPVCLLFRQRTERMMGHWAVSVLVIFYLGFLGSYALWLRCWAGGPLGVGILLGVVAVVKLTDVGAYFTGVAFGRRPLMPKISPKKTWEGLAGGLLAAGVASVVIFGFAIPAGWPSGGFDHLTLIQVFVFGIVMAIVGQVGDLAESLLKRDTGAKDSGQLVPEFGGILDIIDSPLVAMPVAYALLRWWLAGS